MGVALVEFKVGDLVRVNGATFFSGSAAPENPNTIIHASTLHLFGRVGVVKSIDLIGPGIVTIQYLQSEDTDRFAAYQLEKLANISPE